MKRIPLSGARGARLFALVDDADYELVSRYTWNLLVTKTGVRYATAYVPGQRNRLRMHTLITGLPFVDHKDGDGLNNQRYNLRESNKKLNAANGRGHQDSVSPFKGVSPYRRTGRHWVAQVGSDGTNEFLGLYPTQEEAARAYDTAAYAIWQEHSRLNFPDEIPDITGLPVGGSAAEVARAFVGRRQAAVAAKRAERVATVVELRLGGMSEVDIAARVGVSVTTVGRDLSGAGCPGCVPRGDGGLRYSHPRGPWMATGWGPVGAVRPAR